MNKFFQRDIFINKIYEAARKDNNIIFISADFGAPALDNFRTNLPKQFIHSGISEQHMIDLAAGLSLSGKKVYVYAMAPFITLRCLEQIKCSLAMMSLQVTIIAVGVGLGYGDAGPTHYLNEDIACMKSIVGLDIFSPSDSISTEFVASQTLNNPGLRLIRLERHSLENIYNDTTIFNEQGFSKIHEGNELAILSYGHLIHRSLKAVKELSKEGINVGLFDIYSTKPIPKSLIENIKEYKKIITYEEQCLAGGFGASIIEYLSDNQIQIKVNRLGLPDRYYFENGGRELLLDHYNLSIDNLINTTRNLIK